MNKCVVCNRKRKILSDDGLCNSCSLNRAQRGQFDSKTQARIDEIVQLAQDQPDPTITRPRATHSGKGRKF